MLNEAQHKDSRCVEIQVETTLSAIEALATEKRASIDRSIASPRPRLTPAVVGERLWAAAAILLFLTSSTLSIASLTRRSTDWLVSKEAPNENGVGWQKGSLEKIHLHDEVPRVVPSTSDNTQPLEHLVSRRAGALGMSIFVVSIVAWVLPVALIFGSSYFEATRGTCCHGYAIAAHWMLAGSALITLTLIFRSVVQSDATQPHRPRWSVDCLTDFSQVVPVCSDVTALEDCLLTCRVTSNGVVCAGFHQCRLTERAANCEQDAVDCGFEMGWAMYASIASSATLTFMGSLVGVGSWFLSQTL